MIVWAKGGRYLFLLVPLEQIIVSAHTVPPLLNYKTQLTEGENRILVLNNVFLVPREPLVLLILMVVMPRLHLAILDNPMKMRLMRIKVAPSTALLAIKRNLLNLSRNLRMVQYLSLLVYLLNLLCYHSGFTKAR